MSLREKDLLNAQAGTGHEPKDIFTVTHLSAGDMSALAIPNSSLSIKKQTFEIGGTEYEFVIDIASGSTGA